MAASTEDLVGQVREEGAVDATAAVALGWLDAAHKLMVARSKCYRKTVSVGSTAPGTSSYDLPSSVLDIQSVLVADEDSGEDREAARVPRRSVVEVRNSLATFVGSGFVVAQVADTDGAEQLTFYPEPDGVLAVKVFGAVRAPDLVIGGQDPVVPEEFFPGLVAGALAHGLRRTENRHDLADAWTAEFNGATEELRRQSRARWNTGVGRVRVQWR